MADTQLPSADVPLTKSAESVVPPPGGSTPEPPLGPPAGPEDRLTTYFRIRARNTLDDCILPAKICAKPGTQTIGLEFARVAIPVAVLAVDWHSWCKGQKPEIPHPVIEDPNIVLLRAEPDLDGVDNEGDDKPYFFATGTYYFAWRDRGQLKMSFPVPTFASTNGVQVKIDGSEFVPGIINAGW